MVLGLPFAHILSGFADDRHRGHDVNAVDPGQVRTGHAKQPFAQVELRLRHLKGVARKGRSRFTIRRWPNRAGAAQIGISDQPL
jgi:hypothetical protein